MAENCPSLEPSWSLGPPPPLFSDSSAAAWISDTFARETQALTRALQASLSDPSSATAVDLLLPLAKPDTEPGGPVRHVNQAAGVKPAATGRVSKRRSRASRRCLTTYITADPANFRQMVQQVTGVRFDGRAGSAEPVFKPEPQRPEATNRCAPPLQGCVLPTLDTSAFLLDRIDPAGLRAEPVGSLVPPMEGTGFGFEPFPGFPTLESWGVM